MTTERLYEFLILSKTLNYSQAAASLYITQSVLSKHINELEKELETKLFIRSTHTVSLTSAGKYLAQEASVLLNKCNESLNSIHSSITHFAGNIHIGCALEFAYANHVQSFVQKFAQRYPEINLQFEVCSNGTPQEALFDFDLLLTPCRYFQLPNNIQQCLITSHKSYLALPKNHKLASKPLIVPSDLKNETLFVPFSDELFGPYAQNLHLANIHTHNTLKYVPTNNLHSALFFVSIEKGVAIIPCYAKTLLPNSLFSIPFSNTEFLFPEYIYYYENASNNAAQLFYSEYCYEYRKDSSG